MFRTALVRKHGSLYALEQLTRELSHSSQGTECVVAPCKPTPETGAVLLSNNCFSHWPPRKQR